MMIKKNYPKESFIVSPHSGKWIDIFRFGFSHGLLSGILITVGWALSPLSFYNDAFVNIPISLLLTKITHHYFNLNPVVSMGFYYILTNLLGFLLLFLGVRNMKQVKWKISTRSTLFKLILFLIISMLVASTLHQIFK